MTDLIPDKIEICLKNKLYIEGYFFYRLFTEFPENIVDMEVVEDKAVAITFNYPEYYDIPGEHIGCYVNPEYRRQGYGKRAIEAIGGIGNREWRIGEDGSGEFWVRMENESD